MQPILQIDWHDVLVPTVSLLELVLRGSVVYLGILIAMRVLRREAGELSTADLLVVVLVADAAQNAMASEYHSITEGAVLIATIFGWNYLLDWLAFKYPWFYALLHATPLLLVKDGKIQRHNLRSGMLTLADLKSQLREQGVAEVAQVKRCYLEPDGHLSVIKRSDGDESQAKPRR
ncbi:MAG: YetF domain-containing protein, partial [Gemmatimonadales bacterium]